MGQILQKCDLSAAARAAYGGVWICQTRLDEVELVYGKLCRLKPKCAQTYNIYTKFILHVLAPLWVGERSIRWGLVLAFR